MWRRFQRDKLYGLEVLYSTFVIPEESLSFLMWRRFQRDKLYGLELLYPTFVIPEESLPSMNLEPLPA